MAVMGLPGLRALRVRRAEMVARGARGLLAPLGRLGRTGGMASLGRLGLRAPLGRSKMLILYNKYAMMNLCSSLHKVCPNNLCVTFKLGIKHAILHPHVFYKSPLSCAGLIRIPSSSSARQTRVKGRP